MCRGLATLPATCLKSAKDIKHRIGFLLHKPDSATKPDPASKPDPTTEPLEVKENEPTSSKSFTVDPVEAEKCKKSFSNLMNNEVARAAFSSFLRSEFSQENIEFWLACEEYRKVSEDKMAAKAREIYDRFIDVNAQKEVNLDSETRDETSRNMLKPDRLCFDQAQAKIFTLMENDSYRRFLKSRLFLDLWQMSPSPTAMATPCGLEKREKLRLSDFGQCLSRCV